MRLIDAAGSKKLFFQRLSTTHQPLMPCRLFGARIADGGIIQRIARMVIAWQ